MQVCGPAYQHIPALVGVLISSSGLIVVVIFLVCASRTRPGSAYHLRLRNPEIETPRRELWSKVRIFPNFGGK